MWQCWKMKIAVLWLDVFACQLGCLARCGEIANFSPWPEPLLPVHSLYPSWAPAALWLWTIQFGLEQRASLGLGFSADMTCGALLMHTRALKMEPPALPEMFVLLRLFPVHESSSSVMIMTLYSNPVNARLCNDAAITKYYFLCINICYLHTVFRIFSPKLGNKQSKASFSYPLRLHYKSPTKLLLD